MLIIDLFSGLRVLRDDLGVRLDDLLGALVAVAVPDRPCDLEETLGLAVQTALAEARGCLGIVAAAGWCRSIGDGAAAVVVRSCIILAVNAVHICVLGMQRIGGKDALLFVPDSFDSHIVLALLSSYIIAMAAEFLLVSIGEDVVDGATLGLETAFHAGLDEGESFAAAGGVAVAVEGEHRFAETCVEEVLGCLPWGQFLFYRLAFAFIVIVLIFVVTAVTGIGEVLPPDLHGFEETYNFWGEHALDKILIWQYISGLHLPLFMLFVVGHKFLHFLSILHV